MIPLPTRTPAAFAMVAAFIIAVSGCTTYAARPATPDVAAASAALPSLWPADQQVHRTTAADIGIANLDARIEALQSSLAADPQGSRHAALAAAVYHRHRVVGRIDDGERALQLIDSAVAAAPDDGNHRLLRAAINSGFHRFGTALTDLDVAARSGVDAAALASVRSQVLLAMGRYDALAAELESARQPHPDFYEQAFRGNLLLLQGDPVGASSQFRLAQGLYRDVDPLPLAWLHVQQGIALLRHQRIDEARVFFEAAHQRLPQYALATEHLAECETVLGNYERARTLYHSVIAQTGNPEFIAALAGLEREAGNPAEAARLQAEAVAGYGSLLARHPSAFAQHAAEFFIEIGEPQRALRLARDNLAVRRDIGSLILVAEAALAAGEDGEACAAWGHVQALPQLDPPERSGLQVSMAGRCEGMAAR